MTANTTYLITGTARGMGRIYVETFLRRPNTTVIATVRDASTEPSRTLSTLPVGEGSVLHVVKLDNAITADPAAAVDHLVSGLGITKIDVYINNAVVTGSYPRVDAVTIEEANKLMQVNTWAVVLLFQALLRHGLLKPGAKVAIAGSSMGSIAGVDQRPFSDASYGTSKAALHFLSRKMHQEHPDLTVFMFDVGLTSTEMGSAYANHFAMDGVWATAEDSAAGCVKHIDAATRETHGGKYLRWDGEDFPW